MSLVLDPSLAFSWYFEDERTPGADAMLDKVVEAGAVVPALWRFEIANSLLSAQRRKLPLATLDQRLRTAGKTLGLVLLGGEA